MVAQKGKIQPDNCGPKTTLLMKGDWFEMDQRNNDHADVLEGKRISKQDKRARIRE